MTRWFCVGVRFALLIPSYTGYFELPKLPESVSKDNGLELWLTLFSAETEEELLKIEAMEVPIIIG
ncbi:MAG: hypothetical protein LBS49_12720 [Candidatus Accumulibacter sp.]|jgi:hypothetical protein|nr:hypothetical protein [Accumulibacter sp.]